MTFSERVKNARIGLRLSQGFVANAIGIPEIDLCRIEAGTRDTSGKEAERLCRLLGIPAEDRFLEKAPGTGRIPNFDVLGEVDRQAVKSLMVFQRRFRKARIG